MKTNPFSYKKGMRTSLSNYKAERRFSQTITSVQTGGKNKMACFLVCAAEAAIATTVSKTLEKKESKSEISKDCANKMITSKKVKWLSKMLWGGSALLALEHIWHGEVSLMFPFLTAMKDPSEKAAMFHEMSTVGVTMCALVTAVWFGMVLYSHAAAKKAVPALESK
jgi:hypothetical protein